MAKETRTSVNGINFSKCKKYDKNTERKIEEEHKKIQTELEEFEPRRRCRECGIGLDETHFDFCSKCFNELNR